MESKKIHWDLGHISSSLVDHISSVRWSHRKFNLLGSISKNLRKEKVLKVWGKSAAGSDLYFLEFYKNGSSIPCGRCFGFQNAQEWNGCSFCLKNWRGRELIITKNKSSERKRSIKFEDERLYFGMPAITITITLGHAFKMDWPNVDDDTKQCVASAADETIVLPCQWKPVD